MKALSGPLGYAAFRRAVTGRVLSAAGSWMQSVAMGWLVFDLTRSAVAVAGVTACSRGPAIVLSLYGGTLADRFDRRRLTMVLYALQAVPAILLALVTWTEAPNLLVLYALTLVIGSLGALASPALQEIVTGTVPSELAAKATAINSASYNVARLIGPVAAGGLIALAGPGPCFAVNAASFGAVVLVAATLPHRAGRSPGKAASMRSAARSLRSDQLLRTLFPVVLLVSVLVGPVQELAAAVSHRYGGGAHVLGFLLSALAAGGLVAVPTRNQLQKRGVQTADALGGSMLLAAASLLLLAAAPNIAVAALAMFLCGIGWDVVYILGLTGAQLAEERVSGLMTGLFFTLTVGGVTLGALLVGGLFDLVGIEWGLTVSALFVALAGAWRLGGVGRLRHAMYRKKSSLVGRQTSAERGRSVV